MWRRATITIGIAAAVAALSGCSMIMHSVLLGEPLPALLQNVKAASGVWGGCPASTSYEAQLRADYPSALSPELDERLRRNFPSEIAENVVIGELKNQGFHIFSVCSLDNRIREADFKQVGGLTPASAAVFWRVDASNRIEWIKGFVAYVEP